jgi:hypothetical protein
VAGRPRLSRPRRRGLRRQLVLDPRRHARAQEVKTTRIEGRPGTATLQRARVWLRLERRTFLNVRMTDPESKTLYG